MGFLHQLHLLLWKNVTLKRRSPAQLLEEKEKQLKKQDEYYKEQVARLEERSAEEMKKNHVASVIGILQKKSHQKMDAAKEENKALKTCKSAQFYKLTTEQYLKASTEIESKFKRYEASPLCAGLQDQILQCYQQNPKQTLNCSSLASQYLHCVNSAKQTMLRRGG